MCNVTQLDTNYCVYKSYEDLLNSYVSDYYVEDHWKKIARSWQNCCSNLTMEQLADLLDFRVTPRTKIYPLSLLSLRCIIANNSLSRKQDSVNISANFQDKKFNNLLWKGVKLKKRHEISIMAELCYNSATKTNCFCIVDIGSGLGHLSRLLAYKYGLKMCTFEANKALSDSAKVKDDQFEKSLNKYHIEHRATFKPVHISKRITNDLVKEDFVNSLRNAFNISETEFKFGIVGLHPCGDLGADLLHLYTKCSEATFINIASCCYMKLTLMPSLKNGFPLSSYCQKRNFTLSYLSCEIACHAIEDFVAKLKSKDFIHFKIHAYRAALEKLLVSHNPELKHSLVSSMKYFTGLTFKEYSSKTCEMFNITVADDVSSFYDRLINDTWHNVVVFYSLRLIFAPLIEAIILLDRTLYLQERGNVSDIITAFDCKISPRNHVIVSMKI